MAALSTIATVSALTLAAGATAYQGISANKARNEANDVAKKRASDQAALDEQLRKETEKEKNRQYRNKLSQGVFNPNAKGTGSPTILTSPSGVVGAPAGVGKKLIGS